MNILLTILLVFALSISVVVVIFTESPFVRGVALWLCLILIVGLVVVFRAEGEAVDRRIDECLDRGGIPDRTSAFRVYCHEQKETS